MNADKDNTNNPVDALPFDEDLRALAEALVEGLSTEAPTGLADAVFEASVRELREATTADRAGYAALDRELPAALAVDPPAGLADRVFAASVAHLPHEQDAEVVVGRIGWAHWSGWRYAAAIGLVFFYAALWARPHADTTDVSAIVAQSDLTRIEYLFIDEPVTDIDRGLVEAEELVRELAMLTGDEGIGPDSGFAGEIDAFFNQSNDG